MVEIPEVANITVLRIVITANKGKMKYWVLVMLAGWSLQSAAFDKTAFFEAYAGTSHSAVIAQREKLSRLPSTAETRAYIGALMMKEASFQPSVFGKYTCFTKGKKILEEEIRNNTASVEFRFLRLTVQEHCPAILDYNSNISSDTAVIIRGFSGLNEALRKVIKNYARTSKALKPDRLID